MFKKIRQLDWIQSAPKWVGVYWATMLLMASSAKAITIEYNVQNISGSQWEYSYFVSGTSFGQYRGFQIYFDYALYSSIDPAPVAPNADWGPLSLQPDAGLMADGVYDAMAFVSNASLASPFVLTFDWAGSGSPSVQSFSLYSCEDEFCSTGVTFGQSGRTSLKGTTTPPPDPDPMPVPEPLAVLLLGIGLLGMAIARRRQA